MLKLLSTAATLSALAVGGAATASPLAVDGIAMTTISPVQLTERPAPEANEPTWRNGCIIFFCR